MCAKYIREVVGIVKDEGLCGSNRVAFPALVFSCSFTYDQIN